MYATLCPALALILFLVFNGSRASKIAELPGSQYVGCYRDRADPRVLRGPTQDFLETLTPQMCVALCKRKGYIYAGLQASAQCFCGDDELPDSAKVSDSDCSGRCSGDSLFFCGGIWRMTIYKTGNSASSIAKLPGKEYVGCYRDQDNPRLLRGPVKDFHDTLTPQMCVDLCNRNGYVYAGLEASVQCFCGDEELPASEKVSDGECSGKCAGDRSLFCGGTWRLTVYKTGNSASTIAKIAGSKYVGCYRDRADPRLFRGPVKDLLEIVTPQMCVALCKLNGYTYAGIEAGFQCFCGDEELRASDKVSDSECAGKCAGDRSFLCGHYWRLTIYKTGDSAPRIAEIPGIEYAGCYWDQADPRQLRGYVGDFLETVTPQMCVTLCKWKGYIYAGLEAGFQCFCGDEELPASDKVSDGECRGRCVGDTSFLCGHYWRLTIYKTGHSASKIAELAGHEYVGCYMDQADPRLLRGHVQDLPEVLTPQLCVALCKRKGYIYAGLQASAQCFCGNEELPASKKVRDSDCSGRCAGDKSVFCGGIWRLTIYKTSNSAETNSNFLGCYFDEHPARRLSSDTKDFGNSFIPENCIEFCKDKGYFYAGLQASTQCFCGDLRPNTDDLRPEADCNSKCSGNQSQICGGTWRNSVYITGYTVPRIAELADKEYMGCYRDRADPRVLRGPMKDFPETLTPQLCVALCQQTGYIYAGLQASVQCFCGDEELPASTKVSDSDCSGRCAGDNSLFCGGIWRMTIYKTGNSGSNIAKLASNEYVGCYRDQADPRLLPGHSQDFHETLTPQICVALCKRKGYVYAGVQASVQCFCGDEDLPASNKVSESDCSAKCSGDRSMFCGGSWRMIIYKTGNSVSSIAKLAGNEYMGCYRDRAEPRMLRGHVQDIPDVLTPRVCVTLCKQKGYIYAGLQAGIQCFCGDEELPASDKVSDSECSGKCIGDRSLFCGGSWRNSVYKTGNSVSRIAELAGNEYVGCYRDQADLRLLRGHMQDFPDVLTPQLCVALCKWKGYIYAGLQASTWCFCGDEELPASEKVGDSDCLGKCAADRSLLCGGAWRNSIYKTGNSASSIAKLAGSEYVGCYIDQADPRLLKSFTQDFHETMTPQMCVALCKRKGFIYAGVQASIQCFCGDDELPDANKVSDSQCLSRCAGDRSVFCGGIWRMTIYKTLNGIGYGVEKDCIKSVTRVNGKAACRNEVVFEENFNSLSRGKWSHIVQIPNDPDYQFVIYNSHPANSYTEDGKLVIKPTLLPDTEVLNGFLHLENCTGNPVKNECGYKARSYIILPPVQSARLTTRKSFSFQYGKIEISAKLPAGDWLVPEIWLEPKNEVYGPGYASGRVRIAMSRGNSDLKLDGKDISSKQLESGVLMGLGQNIRGRTVKRESSENWHKNYHNYSVLWTPENMLFMLDGEQPYSLLSNYGQILSDIMGFTPDVTPIWSSASKIAPFDHYFYISLGVSVGGVRSFPDNIINNGKQKPWKNLEVKGMLNFWRDKWSWQATWHDKTALLKIDYIKVTAL